MWQVAVMSGLMLTSMSLGAPEERNLLPCSSVREEHRCGQRKLAVTPEGVAGPGEFPWLVEVSAVHKVDNRRCDGTLIHRRAVLTPAHCINKDEQMKIVAGLWDRKELSSESNTRQERIVSVKIIHENYEESNLRNNFGILILSEPVDLTANVGIVCLPEEDAKFDGVGCVASGWASNRSPLITKPHKVDPSFICNDVCQTLMLSGVPSVYLDSSLFCSYGKPSMNQCKGNSGTPLVCPVENNPFQYYQVGFVSWLAQCGKTDYPTAWSDVRVARKWIDEKLAEHLG